MLPVYHTTAALHRGCPVGRILFFNKVNTFKWYKERVRPVTPEHNPYDRMKALTLALQWGDSIPVGVIYRSRRPSFEVRQPVLHSDTLIGRLSGVSAPAID
ncbi:MAG: hypothetical protein LC725_03920 [Lentisphaerae bacterium]|nr:hypothetical protein [Lentisphaerota bacterium]